MDLVALQKKLEARYLGYIDTSVTPNVVVKELDTEILTHAIAYFLAAQTLYELEDDGPTDIPYPLLTLLGLSAELFLKGFHPDVNEEYEDRFQEDFEKEAGDRPIKTLKNREVKSLRRRHGHNLERLLSSYLNDDEDLYNYLTERYKIDTGRDLRTDLTDNSDVFIQVRYIFESDKRKVRQYLNNMDIIYRLVESLYNSLTVFVK